MPGSTKITAGQPSLIKSAAMLFRQSTFKARRLVYYSEMALISHAILPAFLSGQVYRHKLPAISEH